MARTTTAERVKIDPQQVPECDYRAAFYALEDSIRLALADPATRKEYERWKKVRKEEDQCGSR